MKYLNHISDFVEFMERKHFLTLSAMIVAIVFGLSYLVFELPFVGITLLVLIAILKMVSIGVEYREYWKKWHGK